MARNGSGTYERAVADYASGTTIDEAAVNSEMDDIATALSGSIAKDGQTTTTAAIPFASGVKTDTLSENTASNGVVMGHKLDLNGKQLILDADADTSITSDTDDQIDIEIAGADDFRFTANLFSALAGSSVSVGHGALVTIGGSASPGLQIHGNSGSEFVQTITAWNASAGPSLKFGRSRSTAIGTAGTIVQDNDTLGSVSFYADDGSDVETQGATIVARVDGTPGANDMPTELVFAVTADGASTATERLFLLPSGTLQHNSAYDTSSTSGRGCAFDITGTVVVQRPDTDDAGSALWLGYDGTNPTSEIELNGDFLSDTNSYGTPASDRAFKENIQDRARDLSKIKMLKRKTWDWKGDAPVSRHARTEGFVAQDVQAVFPHLVSQRRDGKLRYNTMGLVYELWDICQDLIERVEALEV